MTQLNRILLYVRDVEHSASFYVSHFGYTVHRLPGDRITELVPAEGGAHLMLHKAGKAQKPGQVTVKLVFDVKDVRSFCETSKHHGLPFGTIHDADGYCFANAKDPDGNAIQVSSRAFRSVEGA